MSRKNQCPSFMKLHGLLSELSPKIKGSRVFRQAVGQSLTFYDDDTFDTGKVLFVTKGISKARNDCF